MEYSRRLLKLTNEDNKVIPQCKQTYILTVVACSIWHKNQTKS